jgi:hypothetical protein
LSKTPTDHLVFRIVDNSQFKSLGDFGAKSSVAKEIKDFKYDDDELKTMKDLMKNE